MCYNTQDNGNHRADEWEAAASAKIAHSAAKTSKMVVEVCM
jgi:hypothetical protein